MRVGSGVNISRQRMGIDAAATGRGHITATHKNTVSGRQIDIALRELNGTIESVPRPAIEINVARAGLHRAGMETCHQVHRPVVRIRDERAGVENDVPTCL